MSVASRNRSAATLKMSMWPFAYSGRGTTPSMSPSRACGIVARLRTAGDTADVAEDDACDAAVPSSFGHPKLDAAAGGDAGGPPAGVVIASYTRAGDVKTGSF